ncbi:MAG: cyclic nucleotide-binding domain-containing protein [Elstera sp.]|jgi:CRP-like cAMP-binding protein
MGLQQEVQTLRMVPMFSHLDPARLKLISFASERVHIMQGEEFIRQGEEGEDAFVLLSGRAEVTLEGGETQVKLGEVAQNQIVGMIALLAHGRRTATVRALEPMECLRLPKDVFHQMVRDLPDFALAVMRDLSDALERQTAHFREVLGDQAGERDAKH